MSSKSDTDLTEDETPVLEEMLSFSDKYETLQLLGSGGQGQVYKVRDRATGEIYAAKHIAVDNAEEIEKLKNRTSALQQLNHPSIVKYRGFHVQEDQKGRNSEYILITEYAEGESLSKKLEKGTRFTEALLHIIKWQAINALTAAHTRGIVHGDIKPSNIILDQNYNLKVTNFGMAKFLEEKTRTRTLGAESIVYMAPEQKKGGAIVPETDYYALGATLVALAYGRDLGVNNPPQVLVKELTHLSPAFRNSIELLLDEDPQKRKEGLVEKEAKIEETKSKVEVVQFDTHTSQSKKSHQKRHKVEIRGGGLTTLAIIAGIVGYVYRQEIYQTWDSWSARWDAETKLTQTIDQNCDGLVSAEEFQAAYKTATQREFPGIENNKKLQVCFDVNGDANYLIREANMNCVTNSSLFSNGYWVKVGLQTANELIKANQHFQYCKVPQK